jgi:G:T-mismatch repair DNA endonuclease (very short patch repair protein)
MKTKTTEQFIIDAKQKHGDKYDYSKVIYINSHTKITIICKIHNDFQQTPTDHLSVYGCIMCAGVKKKTTEQFTVEAKQKHGDKYDYSKVKYINNKENIIITCKTHNLDFSQNPKVHLLGSGCQKCGDNTTRKKLQMSTEIFIERANKIHNNKYLYENVVMNGVYYHVSIICKQHGDFLQKPTDHLSGCGCPKCWKANYSKQSILYLNFIALLNKINIQHAENGNEYIIDGNIKADGYCKETNSIYEYHGDFWHGNPKVYDLTKINKVNGKTFGELYQKTLEREQLIREMGFNLVVMWESDWNKINNSIRTLQRLFRNSKHR